ncbi:hypothetical protein Z950_2413 [Sulfitobacter mediterraneus KCTC 32188]|nr:hypothetical protein Z950_2413 [Sulfitobacter mediterraneus KCTC 32188]
MRAGSVSTGPLSFVFDARAADQFHSKTGGDNRAASKQV